MVNSLDGKTLMVPELSVAKFLASSSFSPVWLENFKYVVREETLTKAINKNGCLDIQNFII